MSSAAKGRITALALGGVLTITGAVLVWGPAVAFFASGVCVLFTVLTTDIARINS